jgi:class 3 adenylate cyclase/predicted ATPase
MTMSSISNELIDALVSYVPPRVARTINRYPDTSITPTAEDIEAAVLLCDISGFTHLTERLAVQYSGAEELTQLLNAYFSRMISILAAQGGEVVQFGGDALLAVFAAEEDPLPISVQRATQAATQMQAAMSDFASLHTSVGVVELAMKIAIGAGTTLALSVGGVFNRWLYVLGGEPLDQVARAMNVAKRGQILLSPEAQAVFPNRLVHPRPLQTAVWNTVTERTSAALMSYIPGAITYRMMAGQSDWLAELRPLTMLFLGIGGLEYRTIDDLRKLQRAMVALQQTVYRYEGSVNKFVVDDKGVISIIIFGAPPVAHRDDPLRAVRCALDLQQMAAAHDLRMAVGITTGQTFAGPVGSAQRREYTVIGDTVNLAARLMKVAGRGGILSDHGTYWATRNEIDWDILTPMSLKGKAAAVRVYKPLGPVRLRHHTPEVNQVQFVGRHEELGLAIRLLEESIAGQMRVMLIEGDSGVGKTALLNEIGNRWVDRGLVGLMSSGQSIEQQTPYLAWREIFASYFDLESLERPTQAEQRRHVEQRLAEIAPQLRERAALLNDLLNLGIPENDLTRSFSEEPRLRQASLNALLIDLLAIWAAERPLVIALDDAQWLDPLSWKLAQRVARSLEDSRLLLLIVHQPLKEPADDHPYLALRSMEQTEQLTLAPLGATEIAAIAAGRLGVRSIPQHLASLVEQSAAGNPFIAEELVIGLLESGAIGIENGVCVQRQQLNTLQLPDTVQGLVLSRLDRLPAREQLTIKIASVIGRFFGYPTLRAIHPASDNEQQVRDALDELVRDDLLLTLQSYNTLRSHSFKQTITREVAYSLLLHAHRRDLHERVARWYEQEHLDDRSDLYGLLVYHWGQAGNNERELHYAILAGRKFAAEYANDSALAFINRALELTTRPQERRELLWLRMQINNRLGERDAQRDDLQQLQQLAEAMSDHRSHAQILNAWADLHCETSEFQAAVQALLQARRIAEEINDQAIIARSLTIWGQVLEQQGHFQASRGYYEQALERYRAMDYPRGEATNLSLLGNTCFYLSEHAAAYQYDLQALAIRRKIGDRVGEANSLANLAQSILRVGGSIAEARSYQQQALAVARAIGDRANEAYCIGLGGELALNLGDYAVAEEMLLQAIRLYRAVGDRRREANGLNTLGMVYRDVGDYAGAQHNFEQALAIHESINEQSYITYTLLNIGYVQAIAGQTEAAAVSYHRALAISKASHFRDGEGFALAYQAALAAEQGDLVAAEQGYLSAIHIQHELGNATVVAESQAGMARVALAKGELAQAYAYVCQCRAYIKEHGVDGMEFPIQVYLTCFEVLRAVDKHAEAEATMREAHQLLMKRADAISDPAMRESLLTNVRVNWRVLEERLAYFEDSAG